jgi:outer membrane protein OmpA-like peptidoglycan-associated protein
MSLSNPLSTEYIRMRYLTKTLTAALLLAGGTALLAQTPDAPTTPKPRFGLFGNYAMPLHSAAFQRLPDVANCCPEFTGGTGSGFAAGLSYITSFDPTLDLSIRLGYMAHSAQFEVLETQPAMLTTGPTSATIAHELDPSFSMILIEPLLGYNVTGGLRALGGITGGLVLNRTFEQRERLVSPANASFATANNIPAQRTRNERSGDIPDASSIALGVTIGARYDLAMNSDKSILLSPEILFTYNPLTVVSGLSWNTHMLRAGLSVSFVPPDIDDSLSSEELYVFARTITPPQKGAPGVPFVTSVTARGLSERGAADGQQLTSLRIEEFASTRVRPILPYVFFDQGSADIPARYPRLRDEQTEAFGLDKFSNLNAMTTYYYVLNIVGKRMQADPSASITLTGCTDPSDNDGSGSLARGRAEAVKAYLVDNWGISASRITVQQRGLPEQPSNGQDADGRDENRRVEIAASNAAILAPIASSDVMRLFTPAGVRFEPGIDPKVPIASWTLFVTEEDRILRTWHDGDPLPASVDWRVEEQGRFIQPSSSSLEYLLVARDTAGLVIPSPTKRLSINYVSIDSKRASGTADRQLDRYSMILFGFDRSDLSPANQEIVDRIKKNLAAGSTVDVIGYTDRSGSTDYNLKLSEQRALSVARALGVPEGRARGVGETLPLYDNSTPEGRFYSRTVEVLVETRR